MSVVKWSRSEFFWTSSGRPGSWIGHLAARERLDLLRHDVARPDLVPELGEAGGRHESDLADADDA